MSTIIKDYHSVYGRTIAFRYFVDKKLKTKEYLVGESTVKGYPLYIQITVRGQTHIRKSVLNKYVAPDALADFLRENTQAIDDETNALRERILKFKPFDSTDFSLKHALNEFSVMQDDVCDIIGNMIRPEYEKALETDLIIRLRQIPNAQSRSTRVVLKRLHVIHNSNEVKSKRRFRHKSLISVPALESSYDIKQAKDIVKSRKAYYSNNPGAVFGQVFSDAVPANKQVKDLYDLYGVEFWNIRDYCQKIRKALNLTIITLSFFKSVAFKTAFIRLYSKNQYDGVFQGFNKLNLNG